MKDKVKFFPFILAGIAGLMFISLFLKIVQYSEKAYGMTMKVTMTPWQIVTNKATASALGQTMTNTAGIGGGARLSGILFLLCVLAAIGLVVWFFLKGPKALITKVLIGVSAVELICLFIMGLGIKIEDTKMKPNFLWFIWLLLVIGQGVLAYFIGQDDGAVAAPAAPAAPEA
jgi:hypothetical protein